MVSDLYLHIFHLNDLGLKLKGFEDMTFHFQHCFLVLDGFSLSLRFGSGKTHKQRQLFDLCLCVPLYLA